MLIHQYKTEHHQICHFGQNLVIHRNPYYWTDLPQICLQPFVFAYFITYVKHVTLRCVLKAVETSKGSKLALDVSRSHDFASNFFLFRYGIHSSHTEG